MLVVLVSWMRSCRVGGDTLRGEHAPFVSHHMVKARVACSINQTGVQTLFCRRPKVDAAGLRVAAGAAMSLDIYSDGFPAPHLHFLADPRVTPIHVRREASLRMTTEFAAAG